MSDLISRKKIRDFVKVEINPYGKPFEGTAYELGLKIMRYIDAMDSVYDIDKVVEELEIRVNEANNNCLCEMHENGHTLDFENENGRIKGLKEAIKIVKQGVVSDDVCEWKSGKSNDDWKPSCEPNSTYNVFGVAWFRKCPYCGKKIKVVE